MDITPTERELEALKVLWQDGEATVRDIFNRINDSARASKDEGELAYTTVLSLLQVMEQKGLVGHRQVGKAYLYFPKIERNATFRKLAGGLLEKIFDGAMDEYLVHALNSRKPKAEELDRLQKMIDEAKARTKSKRRSDKGK